MAVNVLEILVMEWEKGPFGWIMLLYQFDAIQGPPWTQYIRKKGWTGITLLPC